MQKKNVAALVATLFAVPFAAHADVTLYGFVSAGIESTKATGNGVEANDYKSRGRVVDSNSRIGFKGLEDLGNGTKAIWQVESSLKNFENGGSADNGSTATFATRNSFVGLDNSTYGKVLLGQNDSAYKTLTGSGAASYLLLNPMGDTTAENQGSASIYSRGEARLKNSVHYFSPTWNGLKFGASYGTDESRSNDTNGQRTNAQHFSLAANYVNGGLTLAAGYDRTNDSAYAFDKTTNQSIYSNSSTYKSAALSGKNLTFYKLAGSYKFETGTFVGAGYEFGRFDGAAYDNTDPTKGKFVANGQSGKLKQDDWTVVVGQTFGAATVSLSYSELGKLRADNGSDSDYKAKQLTLGGTYALSKSTSLYGYYTKIRNSSQQAVNFANNAVYNSDSGKTTASLTKGNDPQAIGVGLKVAF